MGGALQRYAAHFTSVNFRWLTSLAVGLLRITKHEASQLLNKTVPIPNDPGRYIISLSVFHQLHCLVRLAL